MSSSSSDSSDDSCQPVVKNDQKRKSNIGKANEGVAEKKAKVEKAPESILCDDGEMFPIGKEKYVKIKMFKNKQYVDLRQYYMNGDKLAPTRKGICLSKDDWKVFKGLIDVIDTKIN